MKSLEGIQTTKCVDLDTEGSCMHLRNLLPSKESWVYGSIGINSIKIARDIGIYKNNRFDIEKLLLIK